MIDGDLQRVARLRTRPLRVAFLVEADDTAQPILTAIFQACFRFWGGRFSLIVPCKQGVPRDAFRPWLEAYDPDIIYSYVDLSEAEQLRLHEDIYPAYLVCHIAVKAEERQDPRRWSPSLPVTPLGIATLLPMLARRSAFGPPAPLKLVTARGAYESDGFLQDSFGTQDLGLERRITSELVGQVEIFAVTADLIEPELSRAVHGTVSNIVGLLTMLGGRERFTTLSQLSAVLTPRPDMRTHPWSKSFNLVVGDAVADRLLYWNLRSFYPVWRDGAPVDLRVPLASFDDPGFCAALVTYLKSIPGIADDDGGGSMNVTLRSASLSADQLAAIEAKLRQTQSWIGLRCEAIAELDDYAPKTRPEAHWGYGISQVATLATGGWTSMHVTAGQWQVTAEIPEHLHHAPSAFQSVQEGYWAVDLDVERGDDGSPYSNVRDTWRLPRRLRVLNGFVARHAHPDGNRPPLPRVSRLGLLTFLTGGAGKLPSIAEPTDHDAIVGALSRGRDWAPYSREARNPPPQLCYAAERSDAGRYFWGVYQLFGGLDVANAFMMNSFWREQLARFGATDQRPEQRIAQVRAALASKLPQDAVDLRDPKHVDRLANLVLKEADAIRLSDKALSWDSFQRSHEAVIEQDWANAPGDEADKDEALVSDRRSLARAVQSLCERDILYQGYELQCRRCFHRTWISIADLTATIACEVCKQSQPAPVDRPWAFKLNGFLREALRRHGVGPLFWTLNKLRPPMVASYWYEGPLGIYLTREAWDKGQRNTDIDLTIVADGVVRMCEVKQSARQFDDPEAYAATFRQLRPDIATIAIMEKASPKINATFARFEKALEGSGIRAELLTFEDTDIDDRAYLDRLHTVKIF